MSEAFLKVVNMSISAGWLVLAVLALRLILKKAPKWVNVLLWGIVAIRLICPFSIESALSLIPSTETISPEIMMDWTPEISTGIEPLDQIVNPVISTSFAPQGMASANPLQILIPVAANLWLLGVLILLAYTTISYLTLRYKLKTAVILRDNVFQCETVSSPFVLGILKPRIYLPYAMDDKNLSHVVAHEKAHIRRKDHWWKPLGFLLLTVYWFNPLMWVAYILLCRDIELACDEKVIAELGNEQRADYTQALVACAVNRRMITACPLAFGEVGVKDRVKSIMNYRKPTFWIIVTALVVCVVVAVCFLTDPNPSREFSMNGNNVSDLNPEAIVERILDIEDWESSNIYMNSMNFSLHVDSNFNWIDSQTVSYFFSNAQKTYGAQLRIFPEEGKYFLTEPTEKQEQNRIFLLRHYLEAIKYLPQYEILQMAPADQYIISHIDGGSPSDYERVIRYSSYGVEEIDGWFIHLQIQPLHWDGEGYQGTGEEVIDVFYGDAFNLTEVLNQISFGVYDLDGENKGVTEIRLRNLHNGKDTMIQDEETIESIMAFIAQVQGTNAKSSKGYYGGSYEVQLCNGSRTVLSIGFGDDDSFNCGDYGDGYPARYELWGVTREDVIRFLSQFDSSDFDWGLPMVLNAKLLEIHDGYFIVEPVEGSWELNSASRIEVPMKNMESSPEPEIGDMLLIEYDGQLAETYPARITNPLNISVLV
ncbi:MAG: M56 family metallopeptidase, partial [Bacteroidales bacterium]|nr:M56 family metallopeptidase [Bacteroidales bacterium]